MSVPEDWNANDSSVGIDLETAQQEAQQMAPDEGVVVLGKAPKLQGLDIAGNSVKAQMNEVPNIHIDAPMQNNEGNVGSFSDAQTAENSFSDAEEPVFSESQDKVLEGGEFTERKKTELNYVRNWEPIKGNDAAEAMIHLMTKGFPFSELDDSLGDMDKWGTALVDIIRDLRKKVSGDGEKVVVVERTIPSDKPMSIESGAENAAANNQAAKDLAGREGASVQRQNEQVKNDLSHDNNAKQIVGNVLDGNTQDGLGNNNSRANNLDAARIAGSSGREG